MIGILQCTKACGVAAALVVVVVVNAAWNTKNVLFIPAGHKFRE